MFTLYVLYSEKFNKIYIGQTSDMEMRLNYHNIQAIKGYTVKYRPWIILYTETFSSRSEVMKREKQLKSSRGRNFIWALKESVSLRGGVRQPTDSPFPATTDYSS
jgi:putative endonuclease